MSDQEVAPIRIAPTATQELACLHGNHNWYVQTWPSGARLTLCTNCGLLSHYEPPSGQPKSRVVGIDEGHSLEVEVRKDERISISAYPTIHIWSIIYIVVITTLTFGSIMTELIRDHFNIIVH